MSLQRTNVQERRTAFRAWRTETWISVLVPIVFSIFYFIDIYLRSSEKYFWYDELFTWYISRLPLHSMWAVVKTGVDSSTPAYFLLTKVVTRVFGEDLFSTRLPAIVGFWLLCLCLFRFVTRRAGPFAGIVAMLFPFFTGAFYYSYDARAYGLVLGFCGLALVCWQMTLDKPTERRWLVGFSVCLFIAFLLHCYAIMLAVPFGIVQLTESVKTRRVQLARWAAIAIPAAIACLSYLPLLEAFHSLVDGTQLMELIPLTWSQVPKFYAFLFSPGILLILAVIAAGAATQIGRSVNRDRNSITPASFGTVEVVLGVSFLLLPVFGLLLGIVTGSPFIDRYFLGSLFGLCILTGHFIGSSNRRSWTSIALAGIFVAAFLWSFSLLVWHRYQCVPEELAEPSSGFAMNTSLTGPLSKYSFLFSQVHPGDRVLITWPIDFLYLVNYAPQLAPQMYYIGWSDKDYFARVFRTFRPWSPVKYNIVSPDEFFHPGTHFILVGPNSASFMVGPVACCVTIKSLQTAENHFVAQVEMPRAK